MSNTNIMERKDLLRAAMRMKISPSTDTEKRMMDTFLYEYEMSLDDCGFDEDELKVLDKLAILFLKTLVDEIGMEACCKKAEDGEFREIRAGVEFYSEEDKMNRAIFASTYVDETWYYVRCEDHVASRVVSDRVSKRGPECLETLSYLEDLKKSKDDDILTLANAIG